jgi:S-adenosyl methyltransferase
MDKGRPEQKPATAARIYDYFLGGIHNFPADQEAAKTILSMFPDVPVGARANRAFLRRAVRYLAEAGVRQYLDLGSGIPTEGNVHEVVDQVAPDARVIYVDIDPVAVGEGLEILTGNDGATAIGADLRSPETVLNNPELRRLLDLDAPIGLLMLAVLHFVTEDAEAYGLVEEFAAAVAPGSYLVVSHAASEAFAPGDERVTSATDIIQSRTTTPGKARSRSEIARFFTGRIELVDPGVVWLPEWRPAPNDFAELVNEPHRSSAWAGVGRIVT